MSRHREEVPRPLSFFESNTYSQFGEDGILAEIVHRIESHHALTKWCVEFGAWDGEFLSNTARLIREEDFHAVLIEGDTQRARDLRHVHPARQVVALNALVTSKGDQRLDVLLANTPAPHDFDVLSIDIDGCDYHVWAAVEKYRPKVVVIEYNPTMPNEVDWVQADDAAINQGSSAAALWRLASEKNYVPVALTHTNLIAVASEYADAVLGFDRPTLDELRDDKDARVFIFVGYDGTLFTSQPVTMPWNLHTTIPEHRLQVLPRALRGFRGGRSASQIALRHAVATWLSPRQEFARLRDRFRA